MDKGVSSKWFPMISLLLLFCMVNDIESQKAHECTEAKRYSRTVFPTCTFTDVNLAAMNGSHDMETFEPRPNQYIKVVVFLNSTMAEVPRLMFQKMPNVENLTMMAVGLRDELHKYSFEYANALLVVNLAGNNLTVVDKYAFNGARKVEIIDLSKNTISMVDVTAFGHCTKLKRLSLAWNSLKYVSSDVFQPLENVYSIDLSYNQLQELDKGLFKGCKNLRDVKLVENDLKHIHLQLPFTLLKLDISNNKVESVAVEPVHNRTESDLSELLRVVGTNNSINSFYIHPDFVVSHINLANNRLTNIHNVTQIRSIIDLSLAFNPIGQLPLNSFDNMSDLLFLNLEHTALGRIDFGTFSQGAKLKHLDISYNNLDEIDLDMFAALSSLEELSLNGNNLTTMEFSGLLELFPRLRFIGISNNNWNCKTLANILKYLNKQHIRLLGDSTVQHLFGHNLKGIACHNTKLGVTEKQVLDKSFDNELSETKARLAKISAMTQDKKEAVVKAEMLAAIAASQDNGVVSSSADIKAIKIMVFVLLLINVVFFGIKLGRYIKTKKSSRSIRLSGGVKDENFMDDLVS